MKRVLFLLWALCLWPTLCFTATNATVFSGKTVTSGKTISGPVTGNVPTTVGITTDGGTDDPLNNGIILTSAEFTAPFTGTITDVSIFGYNSNISLGVEIGLYTTVAGVSTAPVGSSPTTFAAQGAWGSAPSTYVWKLFSPVSFAVTGGQTYKIGIRIDQSAAVVLRYAASANAAYYLSSTTYGNPWPNPLSGSALAAAYSFKATLTP